MRNLAKFFIQNYKLTIVLSIMMAIFGAMGLSRLNAESYPTVNFAMATISTSYKGASAEDIETKITKPIEDEIRTVSGIKDVKSTSQPGLSTIFVRADLDNIDVKIVMAELQRAVDRATGLPIDLENQPKFTEIKSEEFPVIELAIVGSNKDRKRDLLADLLKEEIEDSKKVLNVREVGFKKRRFQIRLNNKKLEENHIGINEVTDQITSRNKNIPAGNLQETDTQTLVRVDGKVESKEDLENIVVRSNFSGNTIYLKDVATVEDSEEEPRVLTNYNGEDATLLVVTKKGGADTIELVHEIDEKLAIFKKRYKGEYEFAVYNNEALKVKKKLDILSSNALSGLVLVVVFLLIFLPGRIGIVASLSLPLAVMATIGFMPPFGMNLNAITILALVIALGMLVDNSVVISENYNRLRREGLDKMEAALVSVDKLWLPITSTAFTTIAAFLPMLVTKGIMGQFIKWIPIVVTISLLVSLIESFFFLPMRLVKVGGTTHKDGELKKDWFDKFTKKFENFMHVMIRRRYLVFVAFGIMFFGSIFMMTVANKFMLFPPDETELYIVRVEATKGTRVEETDRLVGRLAKEIKENFGSHINHMVARAGVSQVQLNDPKGKDGNNVGMIILYVDDFAKYNIPSTEFLHELRKIKPDYLKDISYEAAVNGPPVGEAVNATFRSNNTKSLDSVINNITSKLKATPGVINVQVNDVVGDDEVFVEINYEKADRLGLSVNRIGNAIRTAVSGQIVESVNLDNKEVDIFVRFDQPARKNIEDLRKVKIMDNRGNLIPLGSLASFRQSNGTSYIKRYDFKRAKTVTAQIESEIINSITANQVVKDQFATLQKEYGDVSLVFGGEEESTKESMESLWNALVLSLIGIFALLVFLFKSYLRPVIIMTTIPLGLVGFSIAFFLHNRPISFLALIGVIGLGGIIVNSGIVLLTFIDDMKEEGKLPLAEILAKASGIRLKAVLVTSLTTISGLLPTAYGIGGSDALLVPMTLAMAWGLTSGTILTLVWVPCAYAILEDYSALLQRIFSRHKNNESTNEALV